MKYHVTYKQIIGEHEPELYCKEVESTEKLVRYLEIMEDGDMFVLISVVPVKE